MNIVYFLGAGASHSLCPYLPTGAGLTLANLYDIEQYSDRSDPLQAVCNDLHAFADCTGAVQDNKDRGIEAAFELPAFRQAFPPGSVQKRKLLYCIFRRLQLPTDGGDHVEWQVCSAHKASLNRFLASSMSRGITFITTNYDTLVERGLTWGHNDRRIDFAIPENLIHPRIQTGWPPGGKENANQPLLLMKLHGSIAWQRCDGCCKYIVRCPFGAGAAAGALDGYDCCPICGNNVLPALIEPDYQKNYEDEAISEILKRAEQELARADMIVVAGYSLPEADNVIHQMLQRSYGKSRTQRVVLINKNAEEVKPRFEGIYPGIVEICPTADWGLLLKSICMNRF